MIGRRPLGFLSVGHPVSAVLWTGEKVRSGYENYWKGILLEGRRAVLSAELHRERDQRDQIMRRGTAEGYCARARIEAPCSKPQGVSDPDCLGRERSMPRKTATAFQASARNRTALNA